MIRFSARRATIPILCRAVPVGVGIIVVLLLESWLAGALDDHLSASIITLIGLVIAIAFVAPIFRGRR